MIEAYLEDKDFVCGRELWAEGLKQHYHEPQKKDLQEIRQIMEKFDAWERPEGMKRETKYGRQRVWIRRTEVIGGKTFKVVDEPEQIQF